MTSYEVFYKTFIWTTRTIQKIFSLGYDTFNASSNYLSHILFGSGQVAKYIIGVPLGLLFGAIVAAIIVVKNFFCPPNIIPLSERIGAASASDLSAARIQDDRVPSSDVTNQTEIEEEVKVSEAVVVDIEKERRARERFLEKKNNLRQKANLLVQRLNEQIILLDPTCLIHEGFLSTCEQLRSKQLAVESSARWATKFSHYETKSEKATKCTCGLPLGCGYVCSGCRRPLALYNPIVLTQVPVYIPDEEKRNLAQANCILIKEELEFKTQALKLTLGNYQKRENLKSLRHRLNNIVTQLDIKTTLTPVLSEYLTILDEICTYFSADSSFKRALYVPKSEHAQAYVASEMMGQLARNNAFFSALHPEVRDRIVSTIALSI